MTEWEIALGNITGANLKADDPRFCALCGKDLPEQKAGQKRKYCCRAHAQQHYRERERYRKWSR